MQISRPLLDVSIPPPEKFTLRLVVWRCRKLAIKDELTNMNDVLVRAIFSGIDAAGQLVEVTRESDTHWRAKKGIGNVLPPFRGSKTNG